MGGTIPACAGKTVALPLSILVIRDYPRVRGENERFIIESPQVAGLSPRARGKQPLFAHALLWTRTIPACAGKTG